jgi:gluconate 5-dehydrogenase
MAKALADAGAHVIINSRNAAECAVPAGELNAAGLSASVQSFDVKSEDSIKKAVAAIIEEHGKIDILINNGE